MWIAAKWKPLPIFSFPAIKELFRYSINHIGTIILHFWGDNIEKMLIGKILGSASLGIYNRGLNQVHLITSQIDTILYQVMFPVLSTIQKDKKRVKQVFLNAIGALSLFASPVMLGLFITAKPFILTVYGEKWVDVVPVLQIISFAGLLLLIMSPTKWIYMSQGKTDWMFRWELVSSTTLIVSKCIGAWMGSLEAVALSYLIGNLLLLYPCITIAGKLIDMTFNDVFREILSPFGGAVSMAIFLWILRPLWPAGTSQWVLLFLNVVIGAMIYLFIVHVFKVKSYKNFRSIIAERWSVLMKKRRAMASS
jgi:O-antigen/teichoic acid export membrane protein